MPMSQRRTAIQPGDRFMRVGGVNTVWVVERALDLHDMPPHVHISSENRRDHRVLTFSESALLDKNFFERLTLQ